MRRKKTFTMLEILIALGVCAIGVCSIMVLFPIGANANRDAAMETYAAHAADQLLHYLQYQMSLDWGRGIPDEKLKSPEYSEIKLKNNTGENVFSNILPCEADGIYLIQSIRGRDTGTNTDTDTDTDTGAGTGTDTGAGTGTGTDTGTGTGTGTDTGTGNAEIIDFRGILVVWRSDISILGTDMQDLGIALNVEVSWPAEIPYTARQKALYCLEVYNPNVATTTE